MNPVFLFNSFINLHIDFRQSPETLDAVDMNFPGYIFFFSVVNCSVSIS